MNTRSEVVQNKRPSNFHIGKRLLLKEIVTTIGEAKIANRGHAICDSTTPKIPRYLKWEVEAVSD